MWARARSIVCHCAQMNQVGMEHDIVRALMRVEAWVGGGRVGGRAASLGTGARPRSPHHCAPPCLVRCGARSYSDGSIAVPSS
jgi:hypothetical protein